MFDNGECVVKYSPWSAEVCGLVYNLKVSAAGNPSRRQNGSKLPTPS